MLLCEAAHTLTEELRVTENEQDKWSVRNDYKGELIHETVNYKRLLKM